MATRIGRAGLERAANVGFPIFAGGMALLFVLPLSTGLLAELLAFDPLSQRGEAYTSVAYGFSLLAVLGAAGYLGHLAVRVWRLDEAPAFSACFTALPLEDHGATGSEESKDWPLLIALLFAPIAFLFAGLAGWVEAR